MTQEEEIVESIREAEAVLETEREESWLPLYNSKKFTEIAPKPDSGIVIRHDLPPHFPLASGNHTDVYFEMALAFRKAKPLKKISRRMLSLVEREKMIGEFEVIVGPAMGAMPIIYAMLCDLDLPGIEAMYVEKLPNGKMFLPPTFTLDPEMRILLVDDVLNHGGTTRETIAACHGAIASGKQDAYFVGIAYALNRSSVDSLPLEIRFPTLPCVAALTLPSQDFAPELCPRCVAGHPLWKI